MPMLGKPTVPERNTEPLSTTVSVTTKGKVRALSDQSGISMAEWVRRLVTNATG